MDPITTSKLSLFIYIFVNILITHVQSKINLNSSPSSTVAFGQRIGTSVSSYSLPVFNLGSAPSNLQADCSGEALFGMYADLSSGCSSYHVCHGGRRDTFSCPEGTLFSQELMTCDYWYRVSCGGNRGEGSTVVGNYPPPSSSPPQHPQSPYYPSWSPGPSEAVPSTGTYNPSIPPNGFQFPSFPQTPQSPYSPPSSYPSLPPPPPPPPPSSDRERPETEEEPREQRPPTVHNPFDPPSQPPSSAGPTLPIPVAPNPELTPQYPQYPPQYPPQYSPSGFPQPPTSYSPGPTPTAGQQPPYSFNDWNQDEPEWTYAWMKKLDSKDNKDSTQHLHNNNPNADRFPNGPYTGQPFDFALINDKFGGSAAVKERSDSPNPWQFPFNNLYKKA